MARTFPTRRKGIKMSDLCKEFTEDEVAAWLKTHGLAVLVSRFKDNYIDGKVLMSITYKECVEMIPEIGLRRKLLELLPQVPEQNKGNTQEVTSQEVEANPSTSQSLQADVLQSSTMTFVPPGWKRGGKIPSPVPLPKLSAPLEMDIALGKLGRNQQTDCDFIAEAGRFYTSLCSELGNDYGRIAVALVDKYPALRDRTGDKHVSTFQEHDIFYSGRQFVLETNFDKPLSISLTIFQYP
ncbi:uncharacterized protein [Ptychodera flava]|uniref:uncharacterized protein n=1 Tax=Ptychodera flava TaxID=63121 RepID=UPI00396A5092